MFLPVATYSTPQRSDFPSVYLKPKSKECNLSAGVILLGPQVVPGKLHLLVQQLHIMLVFVVNLHLRVLLNNLHQLRILSTVTFAASVCDCDHLFQLLPISRAALLVLTSAHLLLLFEFDVVFTCPLGLQLEQVAPFGICVLLPVHS